MTSGSSGRASSSDANSSTELPRHASHPTDIFVTSPGHEVLGSPTHYESSQNPRVGQATESEDANADGTLPSRPSLGHRSVTSPISVSKLRSSTIRIASGLKQLSSSGSATPHERQWSVFEQLMQDEGQLTPRPRGARKRPRIGASQSRLSLGDRLSSSQSLDHSILPPDSVMQSPADEEYSDHYFGTHKFTSGPSTEDSSSADEASDASDSSEEFKSAIPSEPPHRFSLNRLPTMPTLYRNILKCALAYFVASLFTFVPQLSAMISDVTQDGPAERLPSPSGHMVATIAVYFNPAKTIGGMVEADLFCIMGLLYSSCICLGSAGMYWWIERNRPGLDWLADVLVILWIGIGISIMAWMKVWMAKPSFNTACSMTTIMIFVVIMKEGGLQDLLQVSFIVFIGSLVSNTICFAIWPQRATQNLQENMIKTLDSFATLLQMLTNTFLLEEPLHQPSHERLQKAVENHQSSFTSLKKNLAEAHSEWLSGGPSGKDAKSSGRAYEDAVDSLNRLAQHLNGLRSGTRLQYELTKAHSDGKLTLPKRGSGRRKRQSNATATGEEFFSLKPNGKGKIAEDDPKPHPTMEGIQEEALLKAAATMFGDLVDDLGPPLKALSTTCGTSLKRLREAFVLRRRIGTKHVIQPDEFHALIDGIERALFTFESTSNYAVMRLYRKNNLSATPSRVSVGSDVDDNQILSGADLAHEHIFLVYFFIFTLQEFARELESLVDAMGRIYIIEQDQMLRGPWWKRIFTSSFKWLHSVVRKSKKASKRRRPPLHRRLSAYITPKDAHPLVSFPKVRPHAPNTLQTPRDNLPFTGRVKAAVWASGSRLREPDLKYAVKAGMATALLAAPAFFDATRPKFNEYRGEWALISFFVVISPTIGATNFLSVGRVLGTLFGAACATGTYTAFSEYPVVLALFGFFYSLPCFYYLVAFPQFASTARFVLLTYNLTCLYCYNLRQRDLSVVNIAFHRSVAVTVGVVWAALVSRFWWPAEARRELSKGLGEFCLNIGWLYTRLVASNSFAPEVQDDIQDNDDDATPTEETRLLAERRAIAKTKLSNSIQEFMAMELHLQIKLIELQGLLAQTQHEPRLKGPFPVYLYRQVLTSLQIILDKLHSMRCVTTREEWYTVREDFIIPVNKERREMVGNIILSFSTLASAFRLKAPLPPYLPPAEESRQRLVDAIRRLDVVKNRNVKGSRQLLFFAYTLAMQGITQELEKLGRTLQDAFGVIGHTPAEFEALFRDERARIEHSV